MSKVHFYYFDLSPDLSNEFVERTHKLLERKFQEHLVNWHNFSTKYVGKDLGFAIATKRGVEKLEVKGPTVSRGSKIVDFSIFLPENIESLSPVQPEDIKIYLDLVFSGVMTALGRYGVTAGELEYIKDECLLELGSSEVIQ